MVTLRTVIPEQDYPRLAELASAAQGRIITAEQLHDERRQAPSGSLRHQRVAVAGDGTVVGYSITMRFPWWGAGRLSIWLAVDPARRGQGIGSALFDEALAFAREQGATRLESTVMDDDASSRAFAQARGFGVDRHLFASTLAVAEFHPAPFAGVVEGLQAEGMRFFTMADVGDTPEAQAKLYEVNRQATLDIPGRERTFQTLEQYQRRICGAAWYRPELQLIAADGEHWVGLASLEPHPDGELWNRMTGVVAPYRGRKIALALKLLAVEAARRHGFARLGTHNDAENAPMLAVNRKLGYRPQPGTLLLQRTLG